MDRGTLSLESGGEAQGRDAHLVVVCAQMTVKAEGPAEPLGAWAEQRAGA